MEQPRKDGPAALGGSPVFFRDMTAADIPTGLRLCRISRWNQEENDWKIFLDLNPHGCRVAVKGEAVIGTVATLRYERKFGWVAMVLVDPEARGQGIGTQLLHESLRILEDMPCVRLDATAAGREIYNKYGFADEFALTRMKVIVDRSFPEAPGGAARPMSEGDLEAVFTMDRETFGADRAALLRKLFERAPQYARVLESGSRLAAYSFGRPGHDCHHIGPVIACDEQSAALLVDSCLSAHRGRGFYLDAPRFSQSWMGWLESRGFVEQRPFMRMCRGTNSAPGALERQFSIAGPELA